jgi:predicted  nucleic acid-binding Zn-ribbon protein
MVSKQVKFYIDEESYERLRKVAEERGMSVPAFVKSLVLQFLGGTTSSIDESIKYLMQREDQLTKEVGRIGVELSLLSKKVERLERELRELKKAYQERFRSL